MNYENKTLSATKNLPIKHIGKIHNGKVRSVYWLGKRQSHKLIKNLAYDIYDKSELGVMVVSDRISAFDVIWRGEEGLQGVPNKGAVLNQFSEYWFKEFKNRGCGNNHLVESPHPLLWIVQKAEPLKVEGIMREYITGSMWRAYEGGKREFGGNILPDGLQKNQKIGRIFTPSTKGTLRGIPDVPEREDVTISYETVRKNYKAFGFKDVADIAKSKEMLRTAFSVNSMILNMYDYLFVDDKKEQGYIINKQGQTELCFIDEVASPDSSRIWEKNQYLKEGKAVESSKEPFRQFLLNTLDRDILLNKDRMPERRELAKNYEVPVEQMFNLSKVYVKLCELVTDKKVPNVDLPRESIIDTLNDYGLVK
tara:strand:+ start:23935 stop:25032 length:1098 start_codon:yes stop_codon:yes gene_type:complete